MFRLWHPAGSRPLRLPGLGQTEIGDGDLDALIADNLISGVGTVKNHVHNVLKKLNLRSRKDAATYLNFVQGRSQVGQLQYM